MGRRQVSAEESLVKGHLVNPASVYRRPNSRPALREAVRLFSYSLRYGEDHPYVKRRRAERNPPLPRNYFTEPKP